jgi:hypothetical protein
MTTERVNPFGDLGDFSAAPAKSKTGHLDVAEEVAAANGFTSRQLAKSVTTATPPATAVPVEPAAAAPATPNKPPKEALPSRRRTTGRSEQVNIKTTFAAKKRLMEISVERDMPLGEILEQALAALEREWGTGI